MKQQLRVNLDGTGLEDVITTGLVTPSGIELGSDPAATLAPDNVQAPSKTFALHANVQQRDVRPQTFGQRDCLFGTTRVADHFDIGSVDE